MYFATFMLIFGNIIPIGKFVSAISELIYIISDTFASIEGIYLSTGFPAVLVLAIVASASFYIFLIIRINRKKAAVFALLLIYTAFLSFSYITNSAHIKKDSITATSTNYSTQIIVTSNKKVCALLSSKYTESDAYATVSKISSENHLQLDALIFTHYTFTLTRYIEILLSSYGETTIYLPQARNESERVIFSRVKGVSKTYGCKVYNFDADSTLSIGDVSFTPTHLSEYGESVKIAYYISCADTACAYLSSGMLEGDTLNLAKNMIEGSDAVIFGSYGKKHKDPYYINDNFKSLKKIVIDTDGVYIKQENMLYYVENGCEVYSHPSRVDIYVR